MYQRYYLKFQKHLISSNGLRFRFFFLFNGSTDRYQSGVSQFVLPSLSIQVFFPPVSGTKLLKQLMKLHFSVKQLLHYPPLFPDHMSCPLQSLHLDVVSCSSFIIPGYTLFFIYSHILDLQSCSRSSTLRRLCYLPVTELASTCYNNNIPLCNLRCDDMGYCIVSFVGQSSSYFPSPYILVQIFFTYGSCG